MLEEFLKPMGITQSDFAKQIGWTYPRLNEIVNGAWRQLALPSLLQTHLKWILNFGSTYSRLGSVARQKDTQQ